MDLKMEITQLSQWQGQSKLSMPVRASQCGKGADLHHLAPTMLDECGRSQSQCFQATETPSQRGIHSSLRVLGLHEDFPFCHQNETSKAVDIPLLLMSLESQTLV